jgi:hypothetical protein
VIALVVLIGLLVAADFGAAAIFEHQVAMRARTQFKLADDPSVRVSGFPFLTQAISGEYDHVTVDATGVPVRDTLHDLEVHADLFGVQAPLGDLLSGSAKSVKVREVEGQVRVKASDVNRALAQNENNVIKSFSRLTIDPISRQAATDKNAPQQKPASEPEGTTAGARICVTVDISGQSTDVCAFGLVTLVQQNIAFEPNRVEIRNVITTGALPKPLLTQLQDLLRFNLAPGGLPFKVTPTAVTVASGVLSVTGKASDVALTGATGATG